MSLLVFFSLVEVLINDHKCQYNNLYINNIKVSVLDNMRIIEIEKCETE